MIKYNINRKKKTVAAYFEEKYDFYKGNGISTDYWINSIAEKAVKVFCKGFLIDEGEVYDEARREAARVISQLDSIAGIATINDGEYHKGAFATIAKSRLLRRYYRTEKNVLAKIASKINKSIDSIDTSKYYSSVDKKLRDYEKTIKYLRQR